MPHRIPSCSAARSATKSRVPEPSPLRVLFFTTALGGGGAESHALRVMNHLDRSRVVPELAVSRRGGSYEPFLRDDVTVFGVSDERIPSSTGRLLASAPGLWRLATARKYDLVCSLMDTPNLVALAALRPMRRRPKHVAVVQIPPSIEFAQTRAGRTVGLPSIRAFYPLADRVVALSRGVARDLESISPRLTGNISVIHNACVDERLLDQSLDAAAEVPVATRPVLLAAGRLTYQKGYPDLLEAFAAVARRVECELWILGEGPERPSIEASIARLGLGSSVRLLGFQANPQAFMRRASVFVLSSLYEGFGNVIVEAVACGAPVVSTDCPHGPAEIIRDGDSGLLVPVGQPLALAAALVRVLTDDALRSKLRESGLRRAEDFHARVIASAYADEFRAVCDESARS